MKTSTSIFLLGAVLLVLPCSAYDGHRVKEGPLSLEIAEIPEASEYGKPVAVPVNARNSGKGKLNVELELGGLVDEWSAVGEVKKSVRLEPGQERTVTFSMSAGRGALSAHYPAHVYAKYEWEGARRTLHAVRIFQCRFSHVKESAAASAPMKAIQVPANGAVALFNSHLQRVTWRYYDQPLVTKAQGWEGSDPQSRAHFGRGHSVLRGTSRNSLNMHPPWVPGGGTIFAEYLLQLPKSRPLTFSFANAIRDNTAKEPPSDGVTFRVWVNDRKLFERHTASKTWAEGKADLSPYAGQRVLLRLESHPGPARDTTCDSCYWADPILAAGAPPSQMTEAEKAALRKRARRALAAGTSAAPGEWTFLLGQGKNACRAAVVTGRNGILDGALAFGRGDKVVVFDGIRASVRKHPVGRWPSQIVLKSVQAFREDGRVRLVHQLRLQDEVFPLVVEFRAEEAGLRVKTDCPRRITDIALGPADQKAEKVYYGHGFCIENPEPFRAGFGGHNLSTSHVGFDFTSGASLLVASDNPPDTLEVVPSSRTYTLHTHLNPTFTLVPSVSGAFDAATKYRRLYEKEPAGGVRRLAGRFCFDIWGGRYADIAETMKQMFAYGLTDSFLTVHVWQRWGYDYRLPDIYPPQPKLGTPADVRRIAEVCATQDVPWGLHDNYIDFYPDAAGYTYENICFSESGQPIKAWLNESRKARSYRWRPDRIMPFVQRNLKLVKPNLSPTHYFLDVFTSARCFDFYDREGNYHSMLETRRKWGEVFAWIREYLGGNAPTTSEAGHDQLIGYLDGADCQHLTLSQKRERFNIYLPCEDWERVPWFDAVLHDKFILHGVGYSSRYQGGRSRRDHGISSDDYITAEILEGHALMMDRGGFGRAAVRKYWLAQDFIRSVALDEIEKVEFADGDIHRQAVAWKSGAKVYVNRGGTDWPIEGKVLPPFGYFARNGVLQSSIERVNGIIVEQSSSPGRAYFSARTFDPDRRLKIRPSVEKVEYLGENRFKMPLHWNALEPAPKDARVFVHFSSPRSKRRDKIAFQADHDPKTGTSHWKGTITTASDSVITVPESYGAGEYDVLVGFYDPNGGGRYPLRGESAGGSSILVGKLIAEGKGAEISGIRVVPNPPRPEPPSRLNLDKRPIDFGPVVSDGAFQIEINPRRLVITPLPNSPVTSMTLRLNRLPGLTSQTPKSLIATGQDGVKKRTVEFRQKGATITFTTAATDFAYRLSLQ